jgi:hypothetical protein
MLLVYRYKHFTDRKGKNTTQSHTIHALNIWRRKKIGSPAGSHITGSASNLSISANFKRLSGMNKRPRWDLRRKTWHSLLNYISRGYSAIFWGILNYTGSSMKPLLVFHQFFGNHKNGLACVLCYIKKAIKCSQRNYTFIFLLLSYSSRKI